jgi:hypothetical protein
MFVDVDVKNHRYMFVKTTATHVFTQKFKLFMILNSAYSLNMMGYPLDRILGHDMDGDNIDIHLGYKILQQILSLCDDIVASNN